MNVENKINLLEKKIIELNNKIEVQNQKLDLIITILNDDIKENCTKMSEHINFIETVYDKVKAPMYFICNKFNKIPSIKVINVFTDGSSINNGRKNMQHSGGIGIYVEDTNKEITIPANHQSLVELVLTKSSMRSNLSYACFHLSAHTCSCVSKAFATSFTVVLFVMIQSSVKRLTHNVFVITKYLKSFIRIF